MAFPYLRGARKSDYSVQQLVCPTSLQNDCETFYEGAYETLFRCERGAPSFRPEPLARMMTPRRNCFSYQPRLNNFGYPFSQASGRIARIGGVRAGVSTRFIWIQTGLLYELPFACKPWRTLPH